MGSGRAGKPVAGRHVEVHLGDNQTIISILVSAIRGVEVVVPLPADVIGIIEPAGVHVAGTAVTDGAVAVDVLVVGASVGTGDSVNARINDGRESAIRQTLQVALIDCDSQSTVLVGLV